MKTRGRPGIYFHLFMLDKAVSKGLLDRVCAPRARCIRPPGPD